MPPSPQSASKTSLQEPRLQGWSKEDAPVVEQNRVREHPSKLAMCGFIGPGGTHPRALSELAGVTVRPLPTFGQSQQLGEVPKDGRKASITPIFKEAPGATGQ